MINLNVWRESQRISDKISLKFQTWNFRSQEIFSTETFENHLFTLSNFFSDFAILVGGRWVWIISKVWKTYFQTKKSNCGSPQRRREKFFCRKTEDGQRPVPVDYLSCRELLWHESCQFLHESLTKLPPGFQQRHLSVFWSFNFLPYKPSQRLLY